MVGYAVPSRGALPHKDIGQIPLLSLKMLQMYTLFTMFKKNTWSVLWLGKNSKPESKVSMDISFRQGDIYRKSRKIELYEL